MTMKKNWQIIGIAVIAAGVLYYPALKLYQFIAKKRAANNKEEDEEEHRVKTFSPAYRGKHKVHPHHRNPQKPTPDKGLA
jgi:hypothetical protein